MRSLRASSPSSAAIDKVAANSSPKTRDAVLDLEVVYKAVHDALKYDEFFEVNEIAKARKLLSIGQRWASTPIAQLPRAGPRRMVFM